MVKNILKELPKDKEVYFAAGKHAAIVRNSTEFGLQFLELQSRGTNGWKDFGETDGQITTTLNKRFGCRKSKRSLSIGGDKITLKSDIFYADVDSFKPTAEFKEMLGYINTAEGEQKKGVTGYAK